MEGDDDSSDALWERVAARARPGADGDAIDREIWERFGADRAIVFTDLSGFSRRVAEFGIVHFLHVIAEQQRLLVPLVERFGGRLVKSDADSLLLSFPTALVAVDASVAMQRMSDDYDRVHAPEDRLLLCIGVGFGRILVVGDADVFGQEVNAASKLGEDIARAGEILTTSAVRDAVGDRIPDVRWEEIAVSVAGSDHNYRLRWTPSGERCGAVEPP